MARPTKYNEYTKAEIIKYIEDGYTQADAAQLAGVSEATFYEWANQYPEFSESIKSAVIKSQKPLLDAIKKSTDWKSKAWLLERRFPNEYAIKQITEHTGKVEQAITVNIVPFIPIGATKDQLERIRSAYGEENFKRGMEAHLKGKSLAPQIVGEVVESKE